MAPFTRTIELVRRELDDIAVETDRWFDRPSELRCVRPSGGGWTIDEILEHITLTNRFLLLTCEKHRRIALHRAKRGDRVPDGESDLDRMESIGQRGSFEWIRPAHMEPSGTTDPVHVRETMRQQWEECIAILGVLDGGIGALCAVKMTVNDLGKIDLYQWLYFIALHAKRHVQQMRAVEAEF